MAAFGIQKVYGKSFEKLAAFLQDLGGRQENDTLQNLLEALASEQNLKKNEGSRRPKGGWSQVKKLGGFLELSENYILYIVLRKILSFFHFVQLYIYN